MRFSTIAAAALLVIFVSRAAEAQQLLVYPSQGQTPEQQSGQAPC